MTHTSRQASITGSLSLHDREHTADIVQTAGRTIHFESRADLVLGARILLSLRRAMDETAEVMVEITRRGTAVRRNTYQAQILTGEIPSWLSRLLNTRSAFRVDADPSEEIRAVLQAGGASWRGVLLDASQEGVGVLVGSSIEVISQIGSTGTLSVVLPEGRCRFSVQLCRLKAIGTKTRLGILLVDDGSLSHRRSQRFLCDYVMRRQRQVAQQRVEV